MILILVAIHLKRLTSFFPFIILMYTKIIQQKAYDFLKRAVFEQYFESKYLKYQYQFPKKKQSEITGKIIKQWDAENGKQNIESLLKLGQQINPQFKQYLRQTDDFWPNIHIWKIHKSDAAPKDFNIQEYSSYQQFPVEQLEKQNQVLNDDENPSKEELDIMTYHYIQQLVKFKPAKIDIDPSYFKGYELMLSTGSNINRQNLINHARICRVKKSIKINQRKGQKYRIKRQRKLPKQINPKVRIFKQEKIKEFNAQNYNCLQNNQKNEEFQTFQMRKQVLTTKKYIKKIMIENQEADFSRQNSIDEQFSSHSNQIERINKYRIKKKRKLIKKNLTLIFETKIKKNRHLMDVCNQCWGIMYQSHQCKKKVNVVCKKKKMNDNKWFLPIYDYQNKVFGFCLICKKFKARDNHSTGPDYLRGFALYPISPIFQKCEQIQFRSVKLHFQRFSNHCQLSNKASFYEQINLGKLPMMKEKKMIKLSCKYVLTASEDIEENIIFGPIGMDCLPYPFKNHFPWQINYFAHTLKWNQYQFVVCPLYRLNSLGFIVNEKQRTSDPNIELKFGIFENEVCLFGKTIRTIMCGEQITVK